MYPINKQAVHNCLIFEMYLLPKHNRYKFVCNSLMQCPMKTRITTYYSDNFTFQCGWCIPWPFSIFNRRHVANILFLFLHRRVTLLFYLILLYIYRWSLRTSCELNYFWYCCFWLLYFKDRKFGGMLIWRSCHWPLWPQLRASWISCFAFMFRTKLV